MDIIVTNLTPVEKQQSKKNITEEHINLARLVIDTRESVISKLNDSTMYQAKKLFNGINYLGSMLNSINTNTIYQCIDNSDINNNICNVSPLIVRDDNGKISMQCPKYSKLNTITNKCVVSIDQINMMDGPSGVAFSGPSGVAYSGSSESEFSGSDRGTLEPPSADTSYSAFGSPS